MKVEGGRIAPMTPEDVRETARYVASHRAGSSPFELVVAGERRAKPEGWRPHRGGLRGGRRHLVDGEHRLLAFRVDGGRVLAVRRDAPSSAARTAGGMRHGQASAGTVVATDSVSADADRDNGAGAFRIRVGTEGMMSVRLNARRGRMSAQEQHAKMNPTLNGCLSGVICYAVGASIPCPVLLLRRLGRRLGRSG
jgi:hypothetical protein